MKLVFVVRPRSQPELVHAWYQLKSPYCLQVSRLPIEYSIPLPYFFSHSFLHHILCMVIVRQPSLLWPCILNGSVHFCPYKPQVSFGIIVCYGLCYSYKWIILQIYSLVLMCKHWYAVWFEVGEQHGWLYIDPIMECPWWFTPNVMYTYIFCTVIWLLVFVSGIIINRRASELIASGFKRQSFIFSCQISSQWDLRSWWWVHLFTCMCSAIYGFMLTLVLWENPFVAKFTSHDRYVHSMVLASSCMKTVLAYFPAWNEYKYLHVLLIWVDWLIYWMTFLPNIQVQWSFPFFGQNVAFSFVL